MPKISYEGVNRQGKRVKSSVNAKSDVDAQSILRVMGISVTKLGGRKITASGELKETLWASVARQFGLPTFQKKVKGKDLVVFTKQLSVMIEAGVSIIRALNILSEQTDNPTVKDVVSRVRDRVETGMELGEAMSRSPEMFDQLYVALIDAGTSSGQLDTMMARLSVYIEKSAKLKRQLMSALSYPLIVVCIAIGMSFVMLTWVVPMFAKNYEDSGKELPALTQIVIDLSNNLQQNIVFIIGFAIGAAILFNRWVSTKSGRYKWDEILLRLPIFGSLIQKISIARFASTMGTLVSSGIAIIEALEVCAKAAGNKVVEESVYMVKNQIEKGKGMAIPLKEHPLYPNMVSSMVSIGESSGQLDTMFHKIAAFYEEEVEAAMEAALKMVEPIMFVVIGGLVGFILIAMYLPVFDLASTVG